MADQLKSLLDQLQRRRLITSYECSSGEVVIVIGVNILRLNVERATAFAKGVLMGADDPHFPLGEIPRPGGSRRRRDYVAK